MMRFLRLNLFSFLSMLVVTSAAWAAVPPAEISQDHLEHLESVIQEGIRAGECPGAVVLVGYEGKVVYRRAFGNRSLVPRREPMTEDTIFDLASLTKVVATTTAVMQLFEQGKIRLQDPASRYWPEFKANGKEDISIRELMTHYSGLRPDLTLRPAWSGYDTAMKLIIAEKPVAIPGSRFIYSDINFETLGEIVRRVSGQPLDVYCQEQIFKPLGMKDTTFKPPTTWRARIAPADYRGGRGGRRLLWGEVHDPTANFMGGVAGHAGLFSTADDLAIFAQMLLNGGTYGGARSLSPLSIAKMTSPENPPGKQALRGLGWDIDTAYSSTRGELFPVGSYGHTGYTGPSIWIDPSSKTYVIFMSSRLHPNDRGNVVRLRGRVATVVAAALGRESAQAVVARRYPGTGHFELRNSYEGESAREGDVKTGIDMLEAQRFAPIAGMQMGLITNQAGRDAAGRRTIDVLFKAEPTRLKAIFAPEHGLAGDAAAGAPVASGKDAETGLPVYSLYGENRRPTEEMLEGLDAIVFDVQDAGARFYTYITTLGYTLEAAARKGIKVVVLDRPNPITGFLVEGPVLEPGQQSFVGYFPMPVRHGMTVGELARMFNGEKKIGARLEVVKMRGWRRADWFDETGLEWVSPSPNLRNMTEGALYPGVAMVEGANVSVGRGTDTPFELVGAPWIDGRKLAEHLNRRRIQGVRFMPVDFTPRSGPFAGERCHGVNIILLDRTALNSPALGIELTSALYKLFPKDFQLDRTLPLIGVQWVVEAIREGRDPGSIVLETYESLERFRKLREKYLLYP